jgi:hypothetical protein
MKRIEQRSLCELMGVSSAIPARGGIARNIAKASTKPIGKLQAEELHLLLSRHIGSAFLLPIAIRILLSDPWQVVAYEHGGLLESVVATDPGHWPSGSQWREDFVTLLQQALTAAPALYDFERNAALEARMRSLLAELK